MFDPIQFKRVVAYYRDCVVQDAGRSIWLRKSDQGREFIPLKLASEWTSSRKGELRAELAGENAPFASELRQRRASSEITYGYPILLDRQRARIVPVFLQPVNHELNGDVLTARLIRGWPDFNDEFAKSIGVTSPEDRHKLLDELGFAQDAEPPPEGLTHFVRRLAELRLSNVVEPLDPKSIPTSPRLKDIKSRGLINRHILVITDRPPFTRGLEHELRQLSKKQISDRVRDTSLSYFFGSNPKHGISNREHSDSAHQITEVVPLNDEQRAAVNSAFRDDLTVVTGPPGTGKSQIVTTVIANAWMRKQSVLFASHNRKAVDVVEDRVNDLAGKPLMIRTGRRAGDRELRNEIISYLSNVLDANVTEQDRQNSSDTRDELTQLERKRTAVWEALEDVRVRRNRVYQLDEEIHRLKSEQTNLDKRFDAAQQAREQAGNRLKDELSEIRRKIEDLGREREVAQSLRDTEIAEINRKIEELLNSIELLNRMNSLDRLNEKEFDQDHIDADFIPGMTRKHNQLDALKLQRDMETRTRDTRIESLNRRRYRLNGNLDQQKWTRQKDQNFAELRKLILDAQRTLTVEIDGNGSIWSRIWKRWGQTARFQRIAGLTIAWADDYDTLGAPPSGPIVADELDIWSSYFADALSRMSEWERDAECNRRLANEIGELEKEIVGVQAEFDEKEFDLRAAELQNDLFQLKQVQIEALHERIDSCRERIQKANDAFERMEFDKRIAERHGGIERRRTEHESEHGAKLAKLDASRVHTQRDIANRSRQFDEAAAAFTKLPMVNDLAVKLKHVENQIWDAGERLINASTRVLPDHFDIDTRRAIGDFRVLFERLQNDQLGGRTYARLMHQMEELFPKVMSALPAWCVTNLSARGNIPMNGGLFDLVVIDEASQCDIPSALPLLYRARRALIIGDPNQLRHITSINLHRDQLLQEKHGLDTASDATFAFSQNSLFDAAARNAPPHQLNEHFRSHADIIGFSNRHWYDNRLMLCTNYDDLKVPDGTSPGIRWTDTKGSIKRGPASSGAVCVEEADSVVQAVVDLVEARGFRGSVGIVTPFRAQANLIRGKINQQLNRASVQRCELITDTSHGFQGDEKDVIFFSPCVGYTMPGGAEWFLNGTANLFNVAITRARSLLVVVGNIEACLASRVSHVKGFAEFYEQTRQNRKQPDTPPGFDDGPNIGHWERPFYEALLAAGLKPMHQYAEGQYRLDFAFVNQNTKLNVEVDGAMYHREWDGSRSRSDLMRDHRLIGMGWKIKRFWVYELRDDMERCVDEVRALVA